MQQVTNMRTTAFTASSRPTALKSQSFGQSIAPPRARSTRFIVKADATENDDDFEARLSSLKKAKGETPYGEGIKKATAKSPTAKPSKKTYDFTGEKLHFESGPHMGDVAVNVALGATLIWLPLTFAAIGRGAFVKYRFTDRRISSITTAPWKNEQIDAAYQEVKDVVCIGRGVGLWGDMVVTLKDNSKIEMRAIPQHQELRAYILKRRDELTGGSNKGGDKDLVESSSKGFAA